MDFFFIASLPVFFFMWTIIFKVMRTAREAEYEAMRAKIMSQVQDELLRGKRRKK